MSDISNNLMDNPTDILYRILGIDISNNQVESSRNSWSNRAIRNGNVNTDYRSFLSSLFQLPDSNINRILRQSLMDPSQNAYKSVLSEEGEKCIKYKKYEVGKFQNDSCPMTLNDFIVDEEIAQLPCNHIFEKKAILKWLKGENASCPVCRKPLDSKEVKKSKNNFGSNDRINSRINSRINPRNMIIELMNRQLEREEEKELQTAIMASLLDQTVSDVETVD